MGKKRGSRPQAGQQQRFENMPDDTPAPVRSAADAYIKAKQDHAKTKRRLDTASDTLQERMGEAKMETVLIDEGAKRIRLRSGTTLVIEKASKPEG